MGADGDLQVYFRLGWHPIPLRGKVPYIQGWQHAHLTEGEFKARYTAGDNVGIVTGWLVKDKIGLCALDMDQPGLIGFRPEPWIEREAMAHLTSVGPRLVFYTDSPQVVGFSRKVEVAPDQLNDEERNLLNWKAQGKESITVLEVLGAGRQFMAPPSRHPETGDIFSWTIPPKGAEEALVIHSLDELKALMEKSVTRSKWILEELFETSKVEAQYDTELLNDWLEKIRARLQQAGETQNYYQFHCPFHPPDKKPSFVIHKTKFYAFDYHDGQAYSLKKLAETLGVDLLGVKARRGRPSLEKPPLVSKEEKERGTLVDELITVAMGAGIQLFEDDRGDAFAAIEGGGHAEIHRIEGKGFERWLRKQYYDATGQGLRKETINDACATIAAIAQFQEPNITRKLHNRVAWHEDSVYYDLSDEKWRAIKIDSSGWKVVENPPILFRRFRHQQPQVAPAEGGSLDDLFEFINVTDKEDQLLVKVDLVSMLVPDIPHPILLVLGPQGCGKSELMRVLRKLVDPSAVLLQSFRYDELEMVLKVYHHYVVYFDNLSKIKQWLSDILCRACTGQGFTKRRLYTDEDSVIFQFRRCVGANGIALSQLSPDFLDRCLTLTLRQIPSEKRRHERELWREFREAKPRILGAILDTLSKAMKIFPTVEIERLPRMADFALWGEAIARALGHKPLEFLNTYCKKIGEQVADVLEQNPIGLAILAFMETRKEWEGPPGELLNKLEDEYFVKKHNIDIKSDQWPGSAVWVTRRIKEVEANLEHEGVKFSTSRKKRRRIIKLTRTKPLTLQGKLELVYEKARELATDSTVSRSKVADALKDSLQRKEVFKLLEKLAQDGKLVPKGIESYWIVKG